MNEISFPEKTPPIRGLREAGRFILGRIQADQFVPLLCQGIRIPYRDRPIKRFISILRDEFREPNFSSATEDCLCDIRERYGL